LTLHALAGQHDHHQLSASLIDLIDENRLAARRRQCLLDYYRRRVHAEEERGDDDPHHLTARQEVTVELSELWAMPASWIRRQLNNALWVDEHFQYLSDLAARGAIDPYRVALIAETARTKLNHDDEYAALAQRLQPFLAKHHRPDGIVACTHKQLRNKLAYVIRVLCAADAEERYRKAHENRDTVVAEGEDGISWLTLAGTTDQIQLAAHRLTLSAQAARADGDPRTIEQLKADIAVDLLVNGATSETAVPQYARPIVNLTVPIQTVMGLADHPGVLSGGQVIPASLARAIAQRPGATWHRMLTDPAGRTVELSTDRYQPTRAIWEQVVGTRTACSRPQCDTPSTACDLDHREPWPLGSTTPINLGPFCRTDHRAKHSRGFSFVQTESGAFAFTTRAGFTYAATDTEHPVATDWPEVPERIQFSVTEIVEAVHHLAEERRKVRILRPDLYWEHDIWLGFEFDQMVYESAARAS